MKKMYVTLVGILLCVAMPVFAHHAAEGIVDEEIYEMIDTMVADTPHADLVFDDMGGGMTELTVTTRTPREMENLLEDGLLTYAAMLDGDVSITIEFDVRSVEMTIIQQE
ncbi:MAG: hypothetical protein C0623_09000 [Desulfuromonas sp.]|nr:MAG: hypothetical protein C0623_09000 [Desulfuromonas sp.]